MNFLSNLFKREKSNSLQSQKMVTAAKQITAKEKQLIFIRESFKPMLKAEGYRTNGNKWWKINGVFFYLMELQNFSWNQRDSVDFCFNFTTGFTKEIKNPKKPSIHDGIPYVRENYFGVIKNQYWREGNSYHIDNTTDLTAFTEQVKNDFELLILPKFNQLISKEAICQFYIDDFWEPRVKQSLNVGYKNIRLED